MSLISSILLIVVFIAIYVVLIEVYTVLFRITGMTKAKSKFQSISLLTSCGYTTAESELVVTDKTRRGIATVAMLTGYGFSVVIVSLLMNLFLNLSLTQLRGSIGFIVVIFVVFVLACILFRIPFFNKRFDALIEKIAIGIMKKDEKENVISVIDNYGKEVVAEINLNYVPDVLSGKSVSEANIKTANGLNILTYNRKGKSHEVNKDTIFQKGDILVVYGNREDMNRFFKGVHTDLDENVPAVKQNEFDLIENYEKDALVSVTLNTVPSFLGGKKLAESRLREIFKINVMVIKRGGKSLAAHNDSVFEAGDSVMVFGPYENIKTAFSVTDDGKQPG